MTNNNFQPGGPVTANVNVDLKSLKEMKCSCGNGIFLNLYQLKHVSAFYTQTGQAQGIELKMYVCTNPYCGRMYGGAMDQSDVKKGKKDPAAPRFDWVQFFSAGILAMQEFQSSMATAKEKAE